jgi:CubicO group peptidase (beta-lactamase class C family)
MPHRLVRRAAFLLALTLALAAAGASATPPAGHWRGAIELPGTQLAVDVDLAVDGDVWSGDISIPAQGAKDLPLTGITVDGDAVRFVIGGVPGEPTFAGTLAADGASIAGTFTQGGQGFPFRLEAAATAAAEASGRLGDLDDWLDAARAAWNVTGVAVAVVADGAVVLARGYGKRDVAGDLPMTADTLVPIGSATKAFTTLVLGTLVDEGKLSWDEPVRRYLPGFELYDAYATAHVNAVDLVTHRSGLPRHDLVWYNNQDLSRQQLVERLRYLPPSKQLREEFQYNNLMYLTAGRLIEVLTGGTWEEAVRQRILEPLGMTSTLFSDAEAQTREDFAKPYRFEKEAAREIPFREVGNMGPAGSISSSANEMSRWLLLHLGKGEVDGRRLIQPATLTQLHTPQMAIRQLPEKGEMAAGSYAMGWFVDAYRGHNRISHGGAIDGFNALVTLLPYDGVGVVVLTNGEGSGFPTALTRHLLDRALGLEPIDWNAEGLARRAAGLEADREGEQRKGAVRVTGTRPAHALGDYAGDYAHPGYGTLRVEAAGAGLRTTYNHIATDLEHWHYETFSGRRNEADPTFEDMKYSFVTDVNGDVAELRVPFEPFVEPIAFARQPDARLSDPAFLQRFAGVYVLGGQEITVAVRGDELTLFVPGQPLYTLEPALGGWFSLAGLQGFRVRFVDDALELHQPNGLFTAKRKQ